ncbi:hypothetical protein [Actinosynnema pretiosum]|uniref:Uncharacterized protein n=1 Tax=Actinosynnema pretiosum TaxID=42197 RepID=A0A290ZG84_9PSEU|nr:hypothetical protein [Actinosynnema pretiosum]ATE58005.1 hypothetical protein CNX65_05550 [Actinosynnema pretiosum]
MIGQGDYHRWLKQEAREQAPRLFAIAYEIGDREDGEIAAYGLAFDDHAETVDVDDGHHTRSEDAAHALALYERFAAPDNLKAHLLWLDQERTERAARTGPAPTNGDR